MGLDFDQLRIANRARIPQFKNHHGELVHNADGSDWSPERWFQALVGEVGEYANIRKKFDRGDLTEEEFKIAGGKELADVVTYLDILAFRLGIDLGAIVVQKFNEITERVGATVYLTPAGAVSWTTKDIAPIPIPVEALEASDGGNRQMDAVEAARGNGRSHGVGSSHTEGAQVPRDVAEVEHAIAAVLRVFAIHAEHSPSRWRQHDSIHHALAGCSHALQHIRGHELDADSGRPHLELAAARMLLALTRHMGVTSPTPRACNRPCEIGSPGLGCSRADGHEGGCRS